MNVLYQCIIISFVAGNVFAEHQFKERFHWSPVQYDIQSLTPEQQKAVVQNGDALPPNSTMLLDIQFWKDDEKLFLSTVQYKYEMTKGSLSLMLGQLDLKTTNPDNKSPPIIPYAVDELMSQAKSTSQLVIDECDRLWFLDFYQMRLFVISLNDGKKIREVNLHTMPGHAFSRISVDVPVNSASGQKECDNTHAYIPHPSKFEFVVYRFKDNAQWNVNQLTFSYSNLNHTLVELLNNATALAKSVGFGFVASVLSEDDGTGNRILYAAHLIMPVVFAVSTNTLKNPPAKTEFKILGAIINPYEGKFALPTLYYHKKTGILFYGLLTMKVLKCWNTKRFPNVVIPDTTVDGIPLFDGGVTTENDISSISGDAHDNLWINELKEIKGFTQDADYNRAYASRVFSAPIMELVKNTKCQPL